MTVVGQVLFCIKCVDLVGLGLPKIVNDNFRSESSLIPRPEAEEVEEEEENQPGSVRFLTSCLYIP